VTVGQCSIYFVSQQTFDFDEVMNFFTSSNFSLIHPETQKIISVDEEGDSFEIEYELVRHKALNSNYSNVKLWLMERYKDFDCYSYIYWAFRLHHNVFVQNFDFYPLADEEIEQVSKVLFQFFLSQIPKSHPLGIYIDKLGHTEDTINWDDFFSERESIADLLPDTLCIKKDKLPSITADLSQHTMKMIDDEYILITSDVQILLSD